MAQPLQHRFFNLNTDFKLNTANVLISVDRHRLLLGDGGHMNNKARLALADKVRKRIDKQRPHYQIIRKRDEIEKEFNTTKLSVKSDFQIVRKAPEHFFVGESMVGIVSDNVIWDSIPPPTRFYLPFFLSASLFGGSAADKKLICPALCASAVKKNYCNTYRYL